MNTNLTIPGFIRQTKISTIFMNIIELTLDYVDTLEVVN